MKQNRAEVFAPLNLVRERQSHQNLRRPAGEPSVVEQVRSATRPRARLATALGALLGGFVPLATYCAAHHDWSAQRPYSATSALLVGGLVYSATTVIQWGRQAFGQWIKAVGFCLLLEGTMLVSRDAWLAWTALAYLVAINGLATGCRLSRGLAR